MASHLLIDLYTTLRQLLVALFITIILNNKFHSQEGFHNPSCEWNLKREKYPSHLPKISLGGYFWKVAK